MTCRSPLIHVEVDSMFNRSSEGPKRRTREGEGGGGG
jgi:hypothetical protein